MNKIEQFLANKAKIVERKGKKVKKTLTDVRTGLEFEIQDPDDEIINDFRKQVKGIDVNKISNGDASEKETSEYMTACAILIAKCVVDPNLNDPKMKEAFNYNIPYEFILDKFTKTEIDTWSTEIVGLAKTIKS